MTAASTAFSAPPPRRDVKFDMYVQEHIDLVRKYALAANIPPSVMMAIALVESNAGTSYLATTANNHFGIKEGGRWNGLTIPRKDDDYQNGKLRDSHFRQYASKEESFADFPEFLKSNPRRYGYLLSLPPDAYAAWAYGLQAVGYATDSMYAEKLVARIHQYELYRYDPVPTPQAIPRFEQASNNDTAPTSAASSTQPSTKRTSMYEASVQVRRNVQGHAPTNATATVAAPSLPEPVGVEADAIAPPCPMPTQRLDVMLARPVFKLAAPRG